MTPLFQGEQVKGLIPQREPILMIDTFWEGSETGCLTGLTIRGDNIFCPHGYMSAEGIIEHMAQSASAWIGHRGESARIGYIGEVRDFTTEGRLNVGDTARTRIEVISEAMGVVLAKAETYCGERLIASCRMKITA